VRDRPFTVLVDADGLTAGLEPSPPDLEPPSAADVEQALNWGYAAALMCAKAVVRDEPWSAKVWDRDLKEQLLLLVEWDHWARYGAAVDVRCGPACGCSRGSRGTSRRGGTSNPSTTSGGTPRSR
jgi:aminoglycoside 6-adenylyltransferase